MDLINRIKILIEKDSDGKRPPHLTTIIVAIFTIPLTWLCAYQSAYSNGVNPDNGILNILDGFGHLLDFNRISSDPYALFDWGLTPIILIINASIVFSIYIYIERRKRMSRNSKGASHWNDWKKHNIQRVYPLGKSIVEDAKENGDDIGNQILGQKTRLCMDNVPKMNFNGLWQGSPGSGKTRFLVKPNLLQFNSSYVVTDPSGELVYSTGQAMMNHGYRVKVFNLDDMRYSCQYNPFRYIKKDEDVLTVVKCLMANTDDSKAAKGDQFFAKAEECLFVSLFYYIWYKYPKEKQNINSVMELYLMAKVSEKNENEQSKLDVIFDELEKNEPNHIAVKNYKIFKQGTGKTLKSILISFGVRMAPFNIPAVAQLMNDDTIHLEELGDRKQILYIIVPSEKQTFNFIAAMMYTQLFGALYARSADNKQSWMIRKGPNTTLRSPVFHNTKEKQRFKCELEDMRDVYLKAKKVTDDPNDKKFTEEDDNGIIPVPQIKLVDSATNKVLETFYSEEEYNLYMDCIRHGKIVCSHNEKLPSNVRCLLDEFANTGEIPHFVSILNTCRKYNISCNIIIQSLGQLKKMYPDDYSAVIDGCSTQVYLAVQDVDDLKRVSELLGNKTVDVINTSQSHGSHGSSSQSINSDSEALMTVSQIREMDSDKCIIFMSGEAPFLDYKYKLEDHPNYKEIDGTVEYDFRRYFVVPEFVEKRESKTEKLATSYKRKRLEQANKSNEHVKNRVSSGISVINFFNHDGQLNVNGENTLDDEAPDVKQDANEDETISNSKESDSFDDTNTTPYEQLKEMASKIDATVLDINKATEDMKHDRNNLDTSSIDNIINILKGI
ncbi:type IV secretion system protein VirD4 [Lachnospiraceae bacterium KHCPX20]|nr:type IV secretion system protein VirD4 [Lachnospiraceae bacterium KHCPX20]